MRFKRTSASLVAVIACAVTFIAGCSATGGRSDPALVSAADVFAASKPESLRPYFRDLYVEGEWNAVLNLKLLAHAAMQSGEFDIAAKALDMSIIRIESIYADDPNAKRARSKFAEERVKDFKGEPYERSMAYYYRGLLYLRKGDYQNARAMFLSAERHDSMSEAEEFQSDFGLMNYLAAWASFCDNDHSRGADLLTRAYKAQPGVFETLPSGPAFLAIVDADIGPYKVGTGQHKERLTVVPRSKGTTVRYDAAQPDAEQLIDIVLAGDVDFQAMTRGGRAVDYILGGKASFKEGTDVAGSVLTSAGLMTAYSGASTGDRRSLDAGSYMALAGIGLNLLSSVTTPAADTRTWSSLPAKIYVASIDPEVHPDPLDVVLLAERPNPAGAESATDELKPVIAARNGKCGFTWATTHRAKHALGAPSMAQEASRKVRNTAFRAEIESTFGGAPL